MDAGGYDFYAVSLLKLCYGGRCAGSQYISPAAAVHGPAVYEERAVAAQAGGIFCKALIVQPEVEESVQSAQSPRGIGRASAHTCAYRDILVEVYSYRRKSEIFLQQPVCPDTKFFFNISSGQIIGCPEMNHRDGVRLDDFQDIHMCN